MNGMDEKRMAELWDAIPIGKANAVTYTYLCDIWHKNRREARRILHELSLYDNGDDFVLIRSSRQRGFYRTDDRSEISAYRKECLNKGRNTFAPVKKCNRILKTDTEQLELLNNLRSVRESCGMKQKEVCELMNEKGFDESLLSKMENGFCLPTYLQTYKLAQIYGVNASELIRWDLYRTEDIIQI